MGTDMLSNLALIKTLYPDLGMRLKGPILDIWRNTLAGKNQDIVEKVRGHASKLPAERREFWSEQVKSLGVVLFPPPKKVDKKPGGASVL